MGCDYAHLRHIENNYPDTFSSVNQDAIRTVEKFLKEHPDHYLKSGWSGVWGKPEEFYTAINGSLVHREDKLPEDSENWKEKPNE